MATEDKKTPKGFAGLGDMMSETDSSGESNRPPPAARPFTPLRTPPAAEPPAPIPIRPPAARPFEINEAAAMPKKPGGSNSAVKWLIGVAVVWVVIWLSNSTSEPPRRDVASSPSRAANSQSNFSPAPAYQAPAQPAHLTEDQPPYGKALSLTRNQIRYCLSEEIRIEGWRSAVNSSPTASVEAFNIGVADYNERCSNFRYRKGLLESVRAEVEANRYSLLEEGRSIAARSP